MTGFRRVLFRSKNGFLIFNKDDKYIPIIKNPQFSLKAYSIKQKEAKNLKKILKIPGTHNVSNALAALSVARILGIKDRISFKVLSEYKGSWRRFEIKITKLHGNLRGKTRRITVISDYGHHPNEILATLKAAREKYPKKVIWCVFQPHQYQRTYYLFNDFVKVFGLVPIDNIIITDIYDVVGREEKGIKAGISSEKLVKKIGKKSIKYLPVGDAEKYVKENIKSGNVLIIMGAGDIYELFYKF